MYYYSHFFSHSFQQTYLSNPLSLADKVTTGTYYSVSLIVRTILPESILFRIPLLPTDKTRYDVHLSFNFTLQLINGNSSDLQKILKILMEQQLLYFLEFH